MAGTSTEEVVTDQNREVVLLRAFKGLEDPYMKAFQVAGFRHVLHFIPVLHYEYTNKAELSSDLLSKDKFSGIVFTSQTAVDACVHSLARRGGRIDDVWAHLPVFVVGKATAQAVGRLGLRSTGTFSGNAEALSKFIIEHFREGVPRQPLLFPSGNLKRETLPRAMEEAGIPLKSLTCYNTLPHRAIQHNLEELSIKPEVECVWVVFFSPSGVNFALKQVMKTFKSKLKVAAIGGTTGDALSAAGKNCDAVAKQPNPDSLVKAVLEAQ